VPSCIAIGIAASVYLIAGIGSFLPALVLNFAMGNARSTNAASVPAVANDIATWCSVTTRSKSSALRISKGSSNTRSSAASAIRRARSVS
jgi:hypothetical protein